MSLLDIINNLVEGVSDTEKHGAIRDALRKAYPNAYCWIREVYSDDGYCIFQVDTPLGGSILYRIDFTLNNDSTATLTSDPVIVVPRMVYDPVPANDDDTAVEERDISDDERKRIPAGDFAGKNKSFPIAKPEDVAAAAASMGRAGDDNYSVDQLKKRIIAIAKRKGPAFVKRLPKKWRDEIGESGGLTFTHRDVVLNGELIEFESEVIDLAEKAVRRDGTVEIKLIRPGWGSSGYYPAETLRRDGPKAFPKGTHMYWNHATEAEDSQRPEGDLSKLASVLVGDAYYKEDHPMGEGLYASAKVFSDYKDAIVEKGPHIGVSIRGQGKPLQGTAEGRSGTIISEIVHGRSVDYVTRPGAGGAVLLESANVGIIKESTEVVDQSEFDALKETVTKLSEALTAKDAEITTLKASEQDNKIYRIMTEAGNIVRTRVNAANELPDVAKPRLIESLVRNPPINEAGSLDIEKLNTQIDEGIKEATAYVQSIVAAVVPVRPAIYGMGITESDDSRKKLSEATNDLESVFKDLGMSDSGAKLAAIGR